MVTAPNQAPVVRADMGVVGLELIGSQSNGIVLTGSFTDADGSGPFSASVRWMNGAAFRPATVAGTSVSASYVYSGSGSRLVTVRVCDAAGACGTDTITVRTGVNRRVVPIAQCVVDGGSAVSPRYTGSFGYDNRTGLALWIPTAGRFENAFTSGASYRGQPQVFVTGRQLAVFTTAFTSGTQTWRLNGSNVSLSPWSRRC